MKKMMKLTKLVNDQLSKDESTNVKGGYIIPSQCYCASLCDLQTIGANNLDRSAATIAAKYGNNIN